MKAKAKVAELKRTLTKLKDQVMDEATIAKTVKDGVEGTNTKHITNWIHQISTKVPQIRKLEHKLGMMQGLDPVLEDIVSDLNSVTDFSTMNKLKAKEEIFDLNADKEDEER